MKSVLFLVFVSLASSCLNAAPPVAKKAEAPKVGTKAAKILEDKKEEDCDDKAKKPVEIKPETISLSGGDTGCSLDDLKKH